MELIENTKFSYFLQVLRLTCRPPVAGQILADSTIMNILRPMLIYKEHNRSMNIIDR